METFVVFSFFLNAGYAAMKMILLCFKDYPFDLHVTKWSHVIDVAFLVGVCIWAASLLNWI